jgi:hypothetical protein
MVFRPTVLRINIPGSRVIALFFLAASTGCDNGGSDSAGEGDTDTDADADTDTDTDADTDTDLPDTLTGSISLTVTDPTGEETWCDTSIDLTGVEAAGDCVACDFTFDLQTAIASEKGSDCLYNNYPYASMHEDGIFIDTWVGFAETYYWEDMPYPNALFWGGRKSVDPVPNWVPFTYGGAVDYSAGTLSWDLQYSQYGYTVPLTYCGDYGWYDNAYTPHENHGGNYTGSGDLDCDHRRTYATWSFVGVDDTYAYVSLDTVAAETAVDLIFDITDSATCLVGNGDDNFECSFPPPSGYSCPSHKLATTKGEVYTVVVRTGRDCRSGAGETGEYQLYLQANADPSLTFHNAGELTPLLANVSAQGSVTIAEK